MKKFIQKIKIFFAKPILANRFLGRSHELKKGCYVKWNKKALIDYNKAHWWATNKEAVKVKEITESIQLGQVNRTIHFETPIEKNWAGETNSVYEYWLEHCCQIARQKNNKQ